MLLKQRTILCVDDDADDQLHILEMIGEIDPLAKIVKAANGMEALQLLEMAKETKELPALIILDINMPRIDGKQTLTTIKMDHQLKAVPVVLFTTSSSALDRMFGEKYGVKLITKPMNLADFRTAVEQMLSYVSISEC